MGLRLLRPEVVHLSATYGSVGTVVVFLIWLSWNVNAVLFGGALATEVEIAIRSEPAVSRPASAVDGARSLFRR